jgi:hypothetical protein
VTVNMIVTVTVTVSSSKPVKLEVNSLGQGAFDAAFKISSLGGKGNPRITEILQQF